MWLARLAPRSPPSERPLCLRLFFFLTMRPLPSLHLSFFFSHFFLQERDLHSVFADRDGTELFLLARHICQRWPRATQGKLMLGTDPCKRGKIFSSSPSFSTLASGATQSRQYGRISHQPEGGQAGNGKRTPISDRNEQLIARVECTCERHRSSATQQ